ncbi:MAG: hypothetical protein DRP64_02390 [Verrucomicrobia bacterium]|nr:MAG: hypothetical protein DRP64_02390 [Verrucomicrobiota bacterium]
MSIPVPTVFSRFRTPTLWIAGTLVFIGYALLLGLHWDYYGLPRPQRPLHDAHSWLRSSGRVGLPVGVFALALFILNLGYLVRKRLVRWAFLGPLRRWMDIHVLTGIIGAGLVAFHSAMAPSSALGSLALFALIITVVTGMVGRTIYIRVPRSLEGRELEFNQVQEELKVFRTQLELAGVQADWLQREMPKTQVNRTGLVGCFLAMVLGDRQRRSDYRRLKQQILGLPKLKSTASKILPAARAYCTHWQWLVRYNELRSLIASWRFFHRWLAILMLCVVVCHVVVALWFGQLGFGGGVR